MFKHELRLPAVVPEAIEQFFAFIHFKSLDIGPAAPSEIERFGAGFGVGSHDRVFRTGFFRYVCWCRRSSPQIADTCQT